jgi:hypothetical protein
MLLAACGGDDDSGAGGTTATSGDDHDLVTGVLSSDLYVSTVPQRFAFTVRQQSGSYAAGGPATISIKAPSGTQSAETPAKLHTKGLPGKRGVYVVDVPFPETGVYYATVKTQGETLELPFQVKAKAEAPAVGSAAPTVASPTTADPMGVKPLCTRDPACPLHTKSLADVIGKGTPVAVMFATPKLCQSQYCGPVLDTLLPYTKQYDGQIEFVHVEIYTDLQATDVVPTVATWNLPGEPWLFGIDAQGKVTGRLDGAFASDEIEQVLAQLVA